MHTRQYGIIGTTLASIFTVSVLFAQTQGEEWEYQGNMDMMGMKMPVPVTRSCEEPQEEITPPMDGNCEMNDVVTQGETTSFRVICTEPERMEGTGTMTRSDDHFEANYSISTAQGDMNFVITGKKLGSCTL